MFILDSRLIGGLRFVFDKLAAVVDTELNDPSHLDEALRAAHMRLDLGEMSQADFDSFEADVFRRRREILESGQPAGPAAVSPSEYKITGIDVRFEGDEHN